MNRTYLASNIGVIDALIDRISETTRNFRLQDEKKETLDEREINIFEQFLPQKKPTSTMGEENNLYPFIVVRFVKEEKGIVEVMIITGTHEQDYNTGWRDPCNVLNRIKIDLQKQPTIGGAFPMVDDSFEIYLPDEQKLPLWTAFAFVRFELPTIQNEEVLAFV